MTVLTLLIGFASGAELYRYPLAAPVVLPEAGVARIDLPPELRSRADPADATDLLLTDGTGAIVPIARIDTDSSWVPVPASLSGELSWQPSVDPARVHVSIRDRALDGLDLSLSESPAAVTATVFAPDGTRLSDPTLLWRTPLGQHTRVWMEPTVGEVEVVLRWHTGPSSLGLSVTGVRLTAPRVHPDLVVLPVDTWTLQEDGWARYDLVLDAPLPLRAIHLQPTEELFERQAQVVEGPVWADPRTWWEPRADQPEVVRRFAVGDARVDAVALRQMVGPVARLSVLVDAQKRPPLHIPDVELELAGVHLLLRDAGPGPHTLYAGAAPGTSPTFDLSVASIEFARMDAPVVAPDPAVDNPEYVPPEVRSGLVGASTPLELDRFRFQHSLDGVGGLVRVALTDDVLADARPDLSDLRVLDGEDHQIPYLLRRQGGVKTWGEVPFERRERGSQSILEVALPHDNTQVSTVSLQTSAPVFSRQVTLSRPRGAVLEPLRSYAWTGRDRPERLTLDVRKRIGDTLVVAIDNGDDPPLPIEGIEITWPAWEVVAWVPADGARLVYGDPGLERPDYDLVLLQRELEERRLEVHALGSQQPLEPAPPTAWDRIVLAGGVGVLVLGLLGLTLALIRAVPEAREEPEEPAPEGEAPTT